MNGQTCAKYSRPAESLEIDRDALVEDASIDFVWCRDVLNHVQLDPSLREFARVLRSGGSVLVYQTFAETACEPEEARRRFAASASVAKNMSAPFFETRARKAGFEVVRTEQLPANGASE